MSILAQDPPELDMRLPNIKQQTGEPNPGGLSPMNPIFGFGERDGIRNRLKQEQRNAAIINYK